MKDLEYAEMPVFKTHILRSKAGGVRVVLHEPGTMPDLKHGFSVSPGTELEASIYYVHLHIIAKLWL